MYNSMKSKHTSAYHQCQEIELSDSTPETSPVPLTSNSLLTARTSTLSLFFIVSPSMYVSIDTEVLPIFELDVHGVRSCCTFVPCFSGSALDVSFRFVRFVRVACGSNLLCILPLNEYMNIPQCIYSLCYRPTLRCFQLGVEQCCREHSCPKFCYRYAGASLV